MNGLLKVGLQIVKGAGKLMTMGAIYTVSNELQSINKQQSKQFNRDIKDGVEHSVRKFKLIKNDEQ
jgi:hypothetical protein